MDMRRLRVDYSMGASLTMGSTSPHIVNNGRCFSKTADTVTYPRAEAYHLSASDLAHLACGLSDKNGYEHIPLRTKQPNA